MEYRTTFWANSSDGRIVFQLPKKIIRIITGFKSRDACKCLLTLELLSLPSQSVLPLMTFLFHNLKYFTFHTSIQSINTKKKLQLHRPLGSPVSYQKDANYAGMEAFNALPISNARSVTDKKHFIPALKGT